MSYFGETISASDIGRFYGSFACPAAYYYEKKARVPRKPNPAFDIGKAVENAITNYHMTGNMDPDIYTKTMDQLKANTYADRFGVPKMGYPNLPEEEKLEYDCEVAGLDYMALLTEYANMVAPQTIIKSQMEIKRELFPGVTLYCYPDIVTAENGLLEIKTAGRTWSESEINKKFQHIIEVMAFEMETGLRQPVQYQVLVKTKTPKVQLIPIEVTDQEIEQVKHLLWQVVLAKRAFNFTPHERDKTHCLSCGKDHTLDFFFT